MRTLLPLLVAGLFLPGCAGSRNVSAAEFQREYALVGQAQTIRSCEYLGQRDGRAYMKVGTMYPVIGWSERVICADLATLEKDFQDSLPEKEFDPPK